MITVALLRRLPSILAAATLVGNSLCALRLAAQARARERAQSRVGATRPMPTTVGPSVHVSSDRPNDPFFETALAVDPNDTRHLIGASMQFMRDGSMGSAVYVSWDGGASWTRSGRVGTDSTVFRGLDPVVLFGPDGTPFYVAGANARVYVHRSLDGGRTWLPGTVVPGGDYDREWVGVDRTGRHRGRMYLAGLQNVVRLDGSRMGVIALSISTDSGKTFGEPIRLVESNNGSVMALGLDVTPDGTILIPYGTGPEHPDPEVDSSSIGVMRSVDGGKTFVRASMVVQRKQPASVMPRALRNSPLVPIAIDTTSGPFAGRVYLAWTEYAPAGPGAGFRVRVASSEDSGRSWVIATANDNADSSDNTTPALAVNRDGVLGVTWYDRRGDPEGRCHRLYFAASVDGGRTFLPNVMAGENRPNCPGTVANWILRPYAYIDRDMGVSPDGLPVNVVGFFATTARYQNAGDTQGLVADSAGRFHALWIGSGDNGVAQLWSTTLSVDSVDVPAAERVDVTSNVRLDVRPSTIDVERRSITVSATVVNETQHAIRGPVLLTLMKPVTKLERLRAINADNGQPGIGAQWYIEVGSDSILAPGERSEVRVLRFIYDSGSPVHPETGEPVRFPVRITAAGAVSTTPHRRRAQKRR